MIAAKSSRYEPACISATADSHEVRDVVEVTIRESSERTVTLLFDPEHNLEERILSEQFVV